MYFQKKARYAPKITFFSSGFFEKVFWRQSRRVVFPGFSSRKTARKTQGQKKPRDKKFKFIFNKTFIFPGKIVTIHRTMENPPLSGEALALVLDDFTNSLSSLERATLRNANAYLMNACSSKRWSELYFAKRDEEWGPVEVLFDFLSNTQTYGTVNNCCSFPLTQMLLVPHKNIYELTQTMDLVSKIKTLIVKGCRVKGSISTVPERIDVLKNLTHLDLSGNLLPQIPDSIANLVALEHLNLSDNQLETLPKSFKALKVLQRLRKHE